MKNKEGIWRHLRLSASIYSFASSCPYTSDKPLFPAQCRSTHSIYRSFLNAYCTSLAVLQHCVHVDVCMQRCEADGCVYELCVELCVCVDGCALLIITCFKRKCRPYTRMKVQYVGAPVDNKNTHVQMDVNGRDVQALDSPGRLAKQSKFIINNCNGFTIQIIFWQMMCDWLLERSTPCKKREHLDTATPSNDI